MFNDLEALQGFGRETQLDAHLLLAADEHGNAIYGLMIACALSIPFWFAVILGVSTIV